jgi:hypothetical protein
MRILTLVAIAGLVIGTNASAASPHYPQTATVEGTPTAAEATAVRTVLSRSFGKEWTDYEKAGHRIHFSVGHADLNGDGRPDLFVLLTDSGFGYCGSGGCAGYAILATPQGYATKAIDLAYFFEKAAVLPAVHYGMHDLRYDEATKIFRWDGKEYR